MTPKSVEESIIEYLNSLGQRVVRNAKQVDKAAVSAIRDQIKNAESVVERLRLSVQLREAQTPKDVEPEPHPGEAVFRAEGKKWADAQGFTTADLQRHAKVPADVLKEAGFSGVKYPARVTSAAGRTIGSIRAPRLDAEADVLPVAKTLGATWKLTDLANAIERDAATARNYVIKLIEVGKVEAAGVDASGQGRAATLYKVI